LWLTVRLLLSATWNLTTLTTYGRRGRLITVDRPDDDPTFPPEFTAGRAGFKMLMTMLIGAFPDLRFITELMVADK